jgi:putative pyoverdin transport system ATP-binding/permease protein
MNLINFLLRSSWRMVAIAIATGLLSGASSAGLIALIGTAIAGNQTLSLSLLAWGFIGLVLVALVTSIVSQVILIRLSQDAVFQMQMRLSRQILSSELSHLEQLGTPRLLASLTEDIGAISNAVFSIPTLCINLAIVGGCLIYVTWLSPKVLLMLLVLLAIAMGSSRILLRGGRKLLAKGRDDQDLLFKHFRTISDGIKELKLNYRRRQDFLTEDLQVTARQFRRHSIDGLTLFSIMSTWGKFIFFFAIGAVLFVLPNLIKIDPLTLSGYVLTFTYLISPMESIVNKLPILSKASIALQKIETLGLSLASRAEADTVPPSLNRNWKSLELQGVTHTYRLEQQDANFTLGPIDLAFYPGEIVFIVGGNGSGKSTLAKLITGLYLPESGRIVLDKQPITDQNREWYRQHFSAIFADFYLFERLLGFDKIEVDRQAQDYLKQLQLERKVKIEQGRLSSTALSQGQRKRLALLTAYLEDRPIYLFDEWAADQDPLFKEIFYSEFLPKLRNQGKTLLVISHDDQYFHLADRVIKLDYGQVVYDRQ